MFDYFTKFWDSVLKENKTYTNPYEEVLENLNPYDINYLNFGRQTGKTTFAKGLKDAWVFTTLHHNANTHNFYGKQKLSSLANGRDALRGLIAPKYLVLDEYTNDMLTDILRLQLKLTQPDYLKVNEAPVIIVLGNKL